VFIGGSKRETAVVGEQTTEIRMDGKGELHIVVRGGLDRKVTGPLWSRVKDAVATSGPERVTFDLGEVTGMDTSGVALLRIAESLCSDRGIDFRSKNLPDSVGQFVRYTKELSPRHRTLGVPSPPDTISRIGGWFEDRLRGTYVFVEFLGHCIAGIAWYVRNPSRFPMRQMLGQIQKTGTDAMPLVIFMSALMGLIMVFQGLSSMGAITPPIYLADMVAIAVTREMAPLLTAVIIAGRTGAAYAAELGTMKINEEIDALSVMDFDVIRYLALPRILALIIAGPLLTILADAAGIIGGLITCVKVAGVTPVAFMDEIRRVTGSHDIYSGLIKGFAFSALISIIGCFCGLRTRITPDSVGVQTTTAVVISIFLIIMADGFFAALFHIYGF
jgi:phospholipid/cholesterol/gamma-HCH transport system permease protein